MNIYVLLKCFTPKGKPRHKYVDEYTVFEDWEIEKIIEKYRAKGGPYLIIVSEHVTEIENGERRDRMRPVS